jgi:membrane-bound ClpP family serine protease
MPDGASLIIALVVVGVLLIAAEVFLPGLIVGTIGLLCLIGSVVLVFVQYGPAAGALAAFVVGGLTIAGFVLWLFLFPRTFIGPLRPSGTARIGGKRVDVTAVGEFLEQGETVVVVAADGMRVAVRRKDGLEPAAPPA